MLQNTIFVLLKTKLAFNIYAPSVSILAKCLSHFLLIAIPTPDPFLLFSSALAQNVLYSVFPTLINLPSLLDMFVSVIPTTSISFSLLNSKRSANFSFLLLIPFMLCIPTLILLNKLSSFPLFSFSAGAM
jgi:hypothetical protein